MWSASRYFGSFIGPTVAGFLVDAYGFVWTTIVFFWLFCVITIVDICHLTFIVWQSNLYGKMTNVTKNTQSMPLLKNNS